ncbi:Tap42 interacting protein [Purpureocillium takamizusanense]|uniref:Tap42 interacting protein n=1 Tax=Purpureocillium takamizusanense TaxID=2060973 RepID=A0A9Q8Q778_9HYPO|nr:Tap42 interacting protein [Purpureocillium takamizusanense]UNI14355.1 Tap42 interacting protein [Purpureocillium takamizusanense]
MANPQPFRTPPGRAPALPPAAAATATTTTSAMNHMSHPDAPFPAPNALAAATTSHTQRRFLISTRKLPISKSGAIDALTERIGIPMPEMIFGDNVASVRHVPSGWSIEFNTPDALDAVDKTDRCVLKVAYARDWESTREGTTAGIKEVVKPYDWSYSTTYRGTVQQQQQQQQQPSQGQPAAATAATAGQAPSFQPTDKKIPIELLKRRDPILFFDEVVLYESELDDNGISLYSVKVRVHAQRMLLLCRLFMRLDNVIVRIRDTRVYVDFDTDEVLREYTEKESNFDDVKKALVMSGRLPDDVTIGLRDPNILDPLLKVVEQKTDSISLAHVSSPATAGYGT